MADSHEPAPLPGLPGQPPAEGLVVVLCEECHRPLTGRLARWRGLGDDCWRKRGGRVGPGVRGFEVEQEGLFGLGADR